MMPPEDLLPDMRRLAQLLANQQLEHGQQQQQLQQGQNTQLGQQGNVEQGQLPPAAAATAAAVGGQPSERHVCQRPTTATDLDAEQLRRLYDRRMYGVVLVPCWAALRGAFPLNGTYFQVGGWTRGYFRSVTRGTCHRGVRSLLRTLSFTPAARASCWAEAWVVAIHDEP